MQNKNRAFTLIELLVVVLIIGILAAVAVPQYKKAVDKTKLTQTIGTLNTIARAEEMYRMANGTYTTDWTQLDTGLTGSASGTIFSMKGQWFELGSTYVTGHSNVSGDIMLYWFFHRHGFWPNKRACYAKADNDHANRLCKNISGKTTRDAQAGTHNVYLF